MKIKFRKSTLKEVKTKRKTDINGQQRLVHEKFKKLTMIKDQQKLKQRNRLLSRDCWVWGMMIYDIIVLKSITSEKKAFLRKVTNIKIQLGKTMNTETNSFWNILKTVFKPKQKNGIAMLI